MGLGSKFVRKFTDKKHCENWSVLSKDMDKMQWFTFLGHPVDIHVLDLDSVLCDLNIISPYCLFYFRPNLLRR